MGYLNSWLTDMGRLFSHWKHLEHTVHVHLKKGDGKGDGLEASLLHQSSDLPVIDNNLE